MTYIYLNTYKGGYMYVGRHTWNGQGLDPHYHGTSKVAIRYRWRPIKEEILEVVPESRRSIAEDEWIEKYANAYGIADCALRAVPSGRRWQNKFRPHGLMLNCQTSSSLQLHSSEAVKKAVVTRLKLGSQQKSQRAATLARDKACHSRMIHASQYRIRLTTGEECVGSNKQINEFLHAHGYTKHIDGVLSQIRSGKFSSPHRMSKGFLKGTIIWIL